MRRVLLTTLPLILSLSTLSCSSQNGSTAQGSADANPPGAPGSVSAVQSAGWSQVSMIANWAKISLDGTGHFNTTRNGCGKEADGALELTSWNKIATAVNSAIQAITREQNQPRPSPSPEPSSVPYFYTTASSDDHCIDVPSLTKMDGIAEVTLGDSPNGPKKTLLDARGQQICVKFQDSQVALQLYDALTTVVDAADKEECPNGWGSN